MRLLLLHKLITSNKRFKVRANISQCKRKFYTKIITLLKKLLLHVHLRCDYYQRQIQRRSRGPTLLFCKNSFYLFFCNHFEALQTVLFEVELIINNVLLPLTQVYPNTIQTCLTLNHFLFGRHLLYSSNTTLTLIRNLTFLSNPTDNWIGENINLRETQRTSKVKIDFLKISVNNYVLVFL